MTRLLIALPLALSALFCGSAAAEGPGTRIRSGSEFPRPPQSLHRDQVDACVRLQGAARQRCLDEARKPVETGRASGPESTGMGSGAGCSKSFTMRNSGTASSGVHKTP